MQCCPSAEIMESTTALTIILFLYAFVVIFLPKETLQTNVIYTEHDSEGIPLAHLMARQIFSKRTRQTILEVNQAELEDLIQREDNVAVLLQDDSKVNQNTYSHKFS